MSDHSYLNTFRAIDILDISLTCNLGHRDSPILLFRGPRLQYLKLYSGMAGTGASGWDTRAERSMAMAAYAMTPVTAQRISVR